MLQTRTVPSLDALANQDPSGAIAPLHPLDVATQCSDQARILAFGKRPLRHENRALGYTQNAQLLPNMRKDRQVRQPIALRELLRFQIPQQMPHPGDQLSGRNRALVTPEGTIHLQRGRWRAAIA